MVKNISDTERHLIAYVASMLPPDEREDLMRDLDISHVARRSEDMQLVRFEIDGYTRPDYIGQRPYSAEAILKDVDDAELLLIIFKDQNQRLLELEIVRFDGGALQRPVLSTLKPAG